MVHHEGTAVRARLPRETSDTNYEWGLPTMEIDLAMKRYLAPVPNSQTSWPPVEPRQHLRKCMQDKHPCFLAAEIELPIVAANRDMLAKTTLETTTSSRHGAPFLFYF